MFEMCVVCNKTDNKTLVKDIQRSLEYKSITPKGKVLKTKARSSKKLC